MTCFGHIIHDCYISLNWGKYFLSSDAGDEDKF